MGYTTISLPFTSGLDTKTDSKMLGPPKVALLQDAIFTNAQRLTKRNGYNNLTLNAVSAAGNTTLTNPTMVKSVNEELVCASNNRLWSLSPTLNKWVDKGPYYSVAVSKTVISAGPAMSSSCAVAGNYAVFAYDYNPHNSGEVEGSNFSFLDITTNTYLTADREVNGPGVASLGYSKACLLGADTLGILYVDASIDLKLNVVGSGSTGLNVQNPVTIASSLPVPYVYDVVNTSFGAIIAYSNQAGGNIQLYAINTTGTILHAALISTAGKPEPLSLTFDPNTGNVWVYWSDLTTLTSQQVYYAIYSSTLTVVLGKTLIAASQSNVQQITSYITSGTTQTCLFSAYALTGNAAVGINPQYTGAYPNLTSVTVSSAGTVGGLSVLFYNLDIYAKPITLNGSVYLPCVYISPSYPTGFLVNMTGGGGVIGADVTESVAKFLMGEAEGLWTVGSNTYPSNYPTSIRMKGYLSQPYIINSSQIYLCSGIQQTVYTNNGPVGQEGSALESAQGVAAITFEFNSIDAFQSITAQNSLVLNGGIVSLYDGNQVAELGFNVFPDNILITQSSSGGSITNASDAKYTYYVTYEWQDVAGNVYESAPSNAYIVDQPATTTGSAIIQYPNLWVTTKQTGAASIFSGATINIYRTQANGTIAYLLAKLYDSSLLGSGSYTDIFPDIVLGTALHPPLYTEGNAILENLNPPPAMLIWGNNNRVWLVDSENPDTTIEYSKTLSPGSGIQFSTGQLELVIDSKFGPITFASGMDEKTVILKQNGAVYFIGDGANDAGTGSTITNPQVVPSDTGCSNSKSGILYPGGILFKATNNKGIYLFSRGVQIQYFGLDVDAFNSQNILSSLLVPNKNQIRFLTSSGPSLLYDYVFNQWSVFTNHTGYSSDSFQGNYVYVRTDGSIYQEDQTGKYLDNATPYAPLILMSWIKATSIQGFQRTRRVELLGDFQVSNGGHGVQISAAYDFISNFSAPVPYVFRGANNPFQYRERLSRQKCDAFQLKIQEIVTGASGEYIDFSDLGLEILAKQGLNKLSGSNSVG